jgi:hypothetical protein
MRLLIQTSPVKTSHIAFAIPVPYLISTRQINHNKYSEFINVEAECHTAAPQPLGGRLHGVFSMLRLDVRQTV